MEKSILIALSGPPRSGKNEVTNRLRDTWGYTHLSISSYMKDLAHDIMKVSFSEEEKDIPKIILNGKTPRDLYIHLGGMEQFNPYMFVTPVYQYIRHMIENSDNHKFVIESIGRQAQWNFLIAERACKKMVIFNISREGTSWDSREPVKDCFPTYNITNNGSLDELNTKVDSTMSFLSICANRNPVIDRKFAERNSNNVG